MKPLYVLRLLLSCLVVLAISTIVIHLLTARPDFSPQKFSSYFTNQSNAMVAAFYCVDGWLRWRGRPMTRSLYDRLRAPLILYMTMTTSIYWLFLHKLVFFTSQAASVANVFQHSGCLTFLLIDLVWDRPETRLCRRNFAVWLIYPIVYGLGIMLQGAIIQWYPYPFLNIEKLGLQSWSVWNFSILATISLIGISIIYLNNALLANKRS